MNYWKVLAIILALLTIGGLQETSRIFTSADADIVENRSWLKPLTINLTLGFFILAIICWRKGKKFKRRL